MECYIIAVPENDHADVSRAINEVQKPRFQGKDEGWDKFEISVRMIDRYPRLYLADLRSTCAERLDKLLQILQSHQPISEQTINDAATVYEGFNPKQEGNITDYGRLVAFLTDHRGEYTLPVNL